MSNKKCVIIGASGQLGYDLVRTCPEDIELIGLTHADIEICDYDMVSAKLQELKPAIVINLAAFHKVDLCEDEPRSAFEVNALAAGNLAKLCNSIGATIVYVSTDYVFSGKIHTPRQEEDVTDPINVYGASKRAGESLVRVFCKKHLIFRVSGLYGVAGSSGKGGGNFVETMIRFAKEGRSIRVVNDQVLTPTYTRELAIKMWEVIATGEFGIFHCTNNGECSWYEFAKEIFRQIGISPNLSPQSTAELGAKAIRPQYSVLANKRLQEMGIDTMRPWQEALSEYLKEKGYLK
jgi:dTDP-4-dehydrorhamnose reductase